MEQLVNSGQQFLNDLVVIKILGYLSTRERIEMRGVSKQFMGCIDHLLCTKKLAVIAISDVPNLEIPENTDQIDFVLIACRLEDNPNALTGQKKKRYEILFQRLETVKTIHILIHRMVIDICQWIYRQFPNVSVYKLFLSQYKWSVFELSAIKSIFGLKVNEIQMSCPRRSLTLRKVKVSRLFEVESLQTIRFPNCHSFFMMTTTRAIIEMMSENVQKLTICWINENICDLLVTRNVRHIRHLNVTLMCKVHETQVVTTLCQRLDNLKSFKVYKHLYSKETLSSFQYSNTLTKLSIKRIKTTKSRKPLDFGTLDKLKKLKIENMIVSRHFIRLLTTSFPNIEQIILRLRIRCEYQIKDINDCCLCLKKFIIDCMAFAKTKPLKTDITLLIGENDISKQIDCILYAICDMYLETDLSVQFFIENWIYYSLSFESIFEKLIVKHMNKKISVIKDTSLHDFTGYTFNGSENNLRVIEFDLLKDSVQCRLGDSDSLFKRLFLRMQ